MTKNKPIRLIELFAGYGSQALALTNLGVMFEHHLVVEIDKYAIKSYNALHDTNFLTKDITKVKDLKIKDKDKYNYIMTYSFPCTDLSLAGKRAGMGQNTRSGLLWEVERLLKQNELPQYLIMENVPAVHNKKNKTSFDKWINFLKDLGYSNHIQDLNAKHYGVPQNRNRTFMVSILGGGKFNFPSGKPLEYKVQDFLEYDVEEKYYLSKRMLAYVSSSNAKWTGNNGFSLINKTLASTINTGEGSRRADASNYYANNDIENYNLKTHDIDVPVRKLTPRECFRLMGLKESQINKVIDTNSNTQLYKQAGNSIVTNVLEAIFKELIR